MSNIITVQSHDHFYGLPVYPHSLTGLRALVAGANGISGQAMLEALGQSPERWSKVYALSRRPLAESYGPNMQNVLVDLLSGGEEIAKVLKENGVEVDYVFFFAYAQPAPKAGEPLWSNTDEMNDVNGRLLSNTLTALSLLPIIPKRIVLQTGAKHYGMHLGPVAIPMLESDSRITLDDNFYYPQEDMLSAFTAKHNSSYAVTRPSWILGAIEGAAMNILYPLSVYAAVQKKLGGKLVFPGDWVAWDKEQLQSTALMNGYFEEWAALTPEAEDEAFNIVDDYRFNWGRFWPILAKWYGLDWAPPDEEAKYQEIEMPMKPRGAGPNGKIRLTFTLIEWTSRADVQKAWKELAAEYNIKSNPLEDVERLWTPINFALISSWPNSISMDKARKLGWHGYADTHASIREIFEKMAEMKVTPPVPN